VGSLAFMEYYLKIGRASDLENKTERAIYRFFEILPGALSWGTLLLAAFFSWKKPAFVAFFIIFFIIFWFLRTVYFSFFLRSSYKRMKVHENTNWIKKLRRRHKKRWRDIYHLIILPTYEEPLEIIRETFLALKRSDYPKDKMIVILSGEQARSEHFKEVAVAIEKEFKNTFFKLLITIHPSDIEGELQGHGANDAWATKQAKKEIIDPLKIPYANIIVSSFDVDTAVFPKYFSCLAFHYLNCKKPERTSFQPIPLYINNIWQASVLSRVFSFSSTFWQMMSQERPEKLITFSSHAMSFKALCEIGFKQTNVVSDDSRIFWQGFFTFNGDYRTEPIFYPVSMDANVAKNLCKTMINVYKQQRRWAYGSGEIAYFFFNCLKNKRISLSRKISLGFELVLSHWTWATSSLLIFFLGWLPLFLGGEAFSQTLISYNLPRLTSRILTIAMLGSVGSAYFGLLLLPPKPPQFGRFKYVFFVFGWFLIPVIMIFFTSVPALEAQTRWMLGKYMGFWPTEKVRKNLKGGQNT